MGIKGTVRHFLLPQRPQHGDALPSSSCDVICSQNLCISGGRSHRITVLPKHPRASSQQGELEIISFTFWAQLASSSIVNISATITVINETKYNFVPSANMGGGGAYGLCCSQPRGADSLTGQSVSQSDDVTGLTFVGVNSPCRSQWLPLRLLVICPARPRPPAASLRWFSVEMKVPRDGKGCLAPRPKPCRVEMTSSAREERGNGSGTL